MKSAFWGKAHTHAHVHEAEAALSPFLTISFCWSHLGEHRPFIVLTEKLVSEPVLVFFLSVFLKVTGVLGVMYERGPEITR